LNHSHRIESAVFDHGVCACWNQNGISSPPFIGGAIGLAAGGAFPGFGLGGAVFAAGATGFDVTDGFGCNHLENCGPAEVGRRFFAGCSI
jgi:hypothetical protein